MIYDWYKLFSLPEWLAEGLVARTLVVELQDRGRERFEITQGNTTAVRHDDTFLPVQFMDRNPYVVGSKAIYKDASDNIWIGFEVAE
jgi:hypothetical protein